MFTGIIGAIGKITQVKQTHQTIVIGVAAPEPFLENYKIGDSMAVNGVCLTAISITANSFQADVMPETFRATNLSRLQIGSPVNLERALPLNGRLEGHLVAGHVDATAKIERIWQEENAIRYQFVFPASLANEIVRKGSVAIDGTSLTIIDVAGTTFSVGLIPHSQATTILANKKVGELVNIETDLVAKYLLKERSGNSLLTAKYLQEHGF